MWTCDDIRICDLTPPTRFDYCWKFPKKKFFWLNRSILLIFRKKTNKHNKNCKQKKSQKKLVLFFCSAENLLLDSKPPTNIKLNCAFFVAETLANFHPLRNWDSDTFEKVKKVRIDSIPCNTESSFALVFLPPFDGYPLKSPFDHRQQIKKKLLKW